MQALILRVLVVDDSDIVRRGICQILKHKLILRSSVKLRTEPTLSARCVSTDRLSCYWTSRCQ
jgi:hypothetical protein